MLLVIMALGFTMNAQRKDVLPEISNEAYGTLTSAVGYAYNDNVWETDKNKIPVKLKPEFKSLKDFEIYGLGKDNFIYYELHKIQIGK